MKRVEMTIDFKSSLEKVFNVVSNLNDCSWRSDLLKVEQLSEDKYLEYNRKNRVTKVRIVTQIENIQFEYDLQNDSYTGHWCGQFASLKDGGCRLYLSFYFEPSTLLGEFVNGEKFLQRYIEDLKKELAE